MNGVEGIPPRDTTVRFIAQFASYFPGEVASFYASEAQSLIDAGVAEADGAGTTAATLRGGLISNPATLLTSLKAMTNASFAITVDGAAQEVGPINLTGASDLASIATTIGNNITGAGCAYQGTQHFLISTDASGASHTLTFARAPAAGTDISAMLMLRSANGATLTQGT